jgi:hypothetical protein
MSALQTAKMTRLARSVRPAHHFALAKMISAFGLPAKSVNLSHAKTGR